MTDERQPNYWHHSNQVPNPLPTDAVLKYPTLSPSLTITRCIPRDLPTDRAGPAINSPPRENKSPKSPIPILRVQTLAYAVCACKPSASVSPGPETTLPSPVRARSHSITTDARGAHPDHSSCSTAARAVPGCSSQAASHRRCPPGIGAREYVRHLVLLTRRRSRCGVLASCQDGEWHGPGDSSHS